MNTQLNQNRRSLKTIAAALALILLWTVGGVGNAAAGYPDRSDELPGMVDIKPTLIVGGAVLAGLLALAIAKHSGNDDKGANEVESAAEAEPEADFFDSDFSVTASADVDELPARAIQPIAGISGNGMCVGVSMGF